MHRNVRLSFRGTTGEAYAAFLGWPLLVAFTLGLLGPFVQFRQRKFFLGNLAWGKTEAAMRGTAGFFYKTFFKMVGMILIPVLLASLAVPALNALGRGQQEPAAMECSSSSSITRCARRTTASTARSGGSWVGSIPGCACAT
jgi:uncharacterized membrane protein YjgN (DUF898 family)